MRTIVDRSLAVDPNGVSCDKINLRQMSGTETTIWESKACISPIHTAVDIIQREETRARSSNDKFRFVIGFGTSKSPLIIVWMSEFLDSKYSAVFFVLGITMDIRALDTDETKIFLDVPPRMKGDFSIFVMKRKFGNKCEFQDRPAPGAGISKRRMRSERQRSL